MSRLEYNLAPHFKPRPSSTTRFTPPPVGVGSSSVPSTSVSQAATDNKPTFRLRGDLASELLPGWGRTATNDDVYHFTLWTGSFSGEDANTHTGCIFVVNSDNPVVVAASPPESERGARICHVPLSMLRNEPLFAKKVAECVRDHANALKLASTLEQLKLAIAREAKLQTPSDLVGMLTGSPMCRAVGQGALSVYVGDDIGKNQFQAAESASMEPPRFAKMMQCKEPTGADMIVYVGQVSAMNAQPPSHYTGTYYRSLLEHTPFANKPVLFVIEYLSVGEATAAAAAEFRDAVAAFREPRITCVIRRRPMQRAELAHVVSGMMMMESVAKAPLAPYHVDSMNKSATHLTAQVGDLAAKLGVTHAQLQPTEMAQ